MVDGNRQLYTLSYNELTRTVLYVFFFFLKIEISGIGKAYLRRISVPECAIGNCRMETLNVIKTRGKIN